MISVDISNIWSELSLPDFLSIEQDLSAAHTMLEDGTGAGAEFRGWLELPDRKAPGELMGILRAAEQIRTDSEVCVVVSCGGSSLGARAAMELLQGANRNIVRGKSEPQVFFAGNSLSTRHWNELLQLVGDKDFSVIVISKSGTTTEPAITFRSLRRILERRYGTDGARRRIYAITDPWEGGLRQMAQQYGWECFSIAPGICSRFSVLSPAGLLPMAVAGIDIMELLEGAAEAKETYSLRAFENPVWLYAGVRNLLYRRGKNIELLAGYDPGFRMFGRWWQQLFAASEGKDGKGLFPVPVEFTADLRSLGQLIQGGERNLLETVIRFDPPEVSCAIDPDVYDLDGLNCLVGKTLADVEETAYLGAVSSHADAGVPVIVMSCGALTARTVGELFFFLQLCCAVSAYTLGVNPFDQPDAEACARSTFPLPD